MSIDAQGTPEPARPEKFPSELWEKASDSDRRKIVEYEKAIAESAPWTPPTWWDSLVTIVLSHYEDDSMIAEVLTASGVIWTGGGGIAGSYFQVPSAEREKAISSIRCDPRLKGRYVDLELVPEDQCYLALSRIPRRSTRPNPPDD